MPHCRVFLDVDQLREASKQKLRWYVANSGCLLAFMTESYFRSVPCINELKAAKNNRRPIILVRETVTAPGVNVAS